MATSRANIFFALLHFATLSSDRVSAVAGILKRFQALQNSEQLLLLDALKGSPNCWAQIRAKSPMPDLPPSHRSDVVATCKTLMPRPSDQEAAAIALQAVGEPQLRQMPRLQAAIVRVFVKTGDSTLLQEIDAHLPLFAQASIDQICNGSPYQTAEGCHLHQLAQVVGNNIASLPQELAQSLVRRLVGNRTFDGFFILSMSLGSDSEMPQGHLVEMIGELCRERQAVDEALKSGKEAQAAKAKDQQFRGYEQKALDCVNNFADRLAIPEIVTLVGQLRQMYDRYPESPLLTAVSNKLLAKNELATDSLLPLTAAATLPATILCSVMRKFEYPWDCDLFQQWLRNPTTAVNETDKSAIDYLLRSYIVALTKIRHAGEPSQLTVGRLIQTHMLFLHSNHHVPTAQDFQPAEDETLASILPRDGQDFLHTPQIWQDPTWQAILLRVAASDESGAMLHWLLDSADPVLSRQESRSNKPMAVEAGVCWLKTVLPTWQAQAPKMRQAWIKMVTAPFGDRHRLVLPYLADSWDQMTPKEKTRLSAYAKKYWQFITENAIPANFVGFMATVLTNNEQLDLFFAQPIHSGETCHKIGRFSELSHLLKTPGAQKRLLSWMTKHAEALEPHELTRWMLQLKFERLTSVRTLLRRLRVERLYQSKTIEELERALEPYGSS